MFETHIESAQIGLWTYKGENFEIAWTDELTAEQKAEAGWWQSEGKTEIPRKSYYRWVIINLILKLQAGFQQPVLWF